jgi:signal transduction histidine kinase
MQIRTQLTILFTLITAAILFGFASVIYYSAKENREKEFYALLKKEAITKANLFFDAKVNAQILQDIYRNNRQILNEVEVAIYNRNFGLLYHDAVEIDFVKETAEMIDEIYQEGETRFFQEGWQVIGLRYPYNGEDFIITAAAYDQYGYNKLQNLLHNSIAVFIVSILFIFLAGRFYSKKAFDPVKEMTEKARTVSARNLDLRLNSKGNKDELSELANTFNEMMNRLENSFDAQKHFVSNISHELRTPLAAMIAELELSVSKTRTEAAYQSAIRNALNDAKKLVRLSNNLLDFAKASYDPSEISFRQVRIDEVLLDAMQQVQQANPNYKTDIHFETGFESEREITVTGNEYLLKVAFANLFENGCKFSQDNRCLASLLTPARQDPATTGPSFITLKFSDKGIGIPPEDTDKIFTPFFRGENRTYSEGNGIGLSLTQKIIHLHNGTISVQSIVQEGTTFTVKLPLMETRTT